VLINFWEEDQSVEGLERAGELSKGNSNIDGDQFKGLDRMKWTKVPKCFFALKQSFSYSICC